MAPNGLKLLSASAADLQQLTEGALTSAELVERYLEQVAEWDRQGPNLRAMIAVGLRPKLLDRANALDNERKQGRTRGPLHGITIVVKVELCLCH